MLCYHHSHNWVGAVQMVLLIKFSSHTTMLPVYWVYKRVYLTCDGYRFVYCVRNNCSCTKEQFLLLTDEWTIG